MDTTRVLMAAMRRMLRLLNFVVSASAKVYLPMARSGSATRNSATIQPARKPMA